MVVGPAVVDGGPRWDRVSKATLLTLLLGSLQCLWIDGF